MPRWPKRAKWAINELAWQGAVQFAIKFLDTPINLLTRDCMWHPHVLGKVGPAYAPYLCFFAQCRTAGRSQDPPGHYRNKTAVVYAISVLENYLKQVYANRKRCSWRSPCGKTFGAYFYDLKDKKGLTWRDMQAVNGVKFLLLIRNAIIHSFGKLSSADKIELKSLRDKSIWPDNPGPDDQLFDDDFRVGQNICLDIIKVVIPGLRRSIEYVMEVERALRRRGRVPPAAAWRCSTESA